MKTQTKLERKINRLIKRETKHWQNYPGFSHISFVIGTGGDICDIVNLTGGYQYPNCISSFVFGSASAIRRLKIEYMIQQTGYRHPNKKIQFLNPVITSEYETYGEFTKENGWDIVGLYFERARKLKKK